MTKKWFFVSGTEDDLSSKSAHTEYLGFHTEEELIVQPEYEYCVKMACPIYSSDQQFYGRFEIIELTPQGKKIERGDLVKKEWEKQVLTKEKDERRRTSRL